MTAAGCPWQAPQWYLKTVTVRRLRVSPDAIANSRWPSHQDREYRKNLIPPIPDIMVWPLSSSNGSGGSPSLLGGWSRETIIIPRIPPSSSYGSIRTKFSISASSTVRKNSSLVMPPRKALLFSLRPDSCSYIVHRPHLFPLQPAAISVCPNTLRLVLLRHHRTDSPASHCSSATTFRKPLPSVLQVRGQGLSPYDYWAGISNSITATP